VSDRRKSSHHDSIISVATYMAMRNDEKIGIIAPSPKRRKLHHSGVNGQDEDRRPSDPESEDRADQLSVPRSFSKVLVLDTTTSRVRNSGLTAIRTGDMSRSNIFKLQVDEMLLAVQPNYSKIMGSVDKTLRRLKILIESIENREPLTVGYFSVTIVVIDANTFT